MQSSLIADEDEDSESDGEAKDNDDGDGSETSKNFAILLLEQFIYEDDEKNEKLEDALEIKGDYKNQCS